MSLLDGPLSLLVAEVHSGAASAVDLTREALDRAEARNPAINAICGINPAALDEAGTVEARIKAGEALPLAGIPVLIKDNIWVKGMRVAQGSNLFADHIAPDDAEAVARLRQAGAVVIGIATCTEFACKGAGSSLLHGTTRNPVDLKLTPGGSSSGSVAAVAAGIVPLALGTDAGGSTRRPPAHTGLCGLEPTQDLIPYGPGFDEPVWGISVICPVAHRMADIALAMGVLGGLRPAKTPTQAIAISADFGTGQPLDTDVAANFDAVVTALKAAGIKISNADIHWPGDIKGQDIQPLQYAGLAQLYGDKWKQRPKIFDPALGEQIAAGLALSGVEVAAAHQVSHKMRDTLCAALNKHSFIATPTTPCVAWPAAQNAPSEIGGQPAAARDHAAFTPQINHAGVPALSIPCGKDSQGRPLGLQLIAQAGADADLIAFGQALEPILQEVT
ncbi:MAG: amidase [Roseobacter sp.]